MNPDPAFRPGVYRHYKGGTYTALMLAAHHDTREPWVVYCSHPSGNLSLRPYSRPTTETPESWTDLVVWPDGVLAPRFVFLQPSE